MSEEELLPNRRPNNNRLLLEGSGLIEEEQKEDDGFLRSGGIGAGMYGSRMPAQRNLSPLIEQEEPEQVSKPSTSNSAKANLARYIFKRQFEGRKRWAKGMPYSAATRSMFGSDSPQEAVAKGTFQPLIGAKMNAAQIEKRKAAKADYDQGRKDRQKNAKGFFSKLWNGITRGRTAMDFFFGARRKPSSSAKALGITSTNAPMGESSGWADSLIDASKAGRLDPPGGSMEAFFSDRLQQSQAEVNQHRSFEHIVDEPGNQAVGTNSILDEEEKVPAGAGPGFFQENLDLIRQLNAGHESNEYGVSEPKLQGNSRDSLDQDDIVNDDDQEFKEKANAYFQMNQRDDEYEEGSDVDDDDNDFIKRHVMGIFNK